MAKQRTDKQAGHRGAYENARKRLLAQDDWICGICGKPIDKELKYPHPMSVSVDHIIPISKGGHPSDMKNLQLAHRCCNRQKSDKYIEHQSSVPAANATFSNRILEQHYDWLGDK